MQQSAPHPFDRSPFPVQQLDPSVKLTAEVIPLPPNRRNRTYRASAIAASLHPGVRPLNGARPTKQREERVAGLPMLYKATYASGRESWVVRYVDPATSKRTACVIGRVPTMSLMEAAGIVHRYIEDLKAGRSPRKGEMTLNEFFFGTYLPWAQAEKKSWKDDESRYTRHIKPQVGDLPLNRVTSRHIRKVHDELRAAGELSDASINRLMMLASAMLREAVRADLLAANPMDGWRQLRETPPSPRALDRDELARLGQQLADAPLHLRLLVQLLLTTGLRIGEALKLRVTDVDFAIGVLHLRDTKAGEDQTVPISPAAREIVLELLAHSRNGFLFPSRRVDGPMCPPRKALRKLLAAAGVEDGGFHRFRKTVATEAMACPGVDLLTVSRLLRHKSIQTTERHYLATSAKRLQHAVAQVGDVLQHHLRRDRPPQVALAPSTFSARIAPALRCVTP